jgi:peptidoglycan/xylan/chitin deacetylase (PgdA/CDA1 family)
MRYLTMSFDDGFRVSSVKTADLLEKYGLRGEFNIVATFETRPSQVFGDWGLWNELQARGHKIQPHGWDHTNKAQIPLPEAQDLIQRCLDAFQENLNGFDAHQTIFAFPYNASTPELEAWLPTVVRAFRTSGPAINPLPTPGVAKLTTGGAEQAEAYLDQCVDELLALDEGWLIYCAHALDGEGWGPLGSGYLDRLLNRLVQTANLQLLPAQQVLATTP